MSETFLYSVHPKRTIKTLPEIGVIRTPKRLYLTLDQVKECLKWAIVYRSFTCREERVTSLNVERFHNDKFMTEAEYKEFLVNKLGNTGNVFVPVTEETPVEDTKEEEVIDEVAPVEEPATEVKEEVAEEITEEAAPAEELVLEDTTVEEAIAETEEVAPVEEPAKEEKKEYKPYQQNYTKKKR